MVAETTVKTTIKATATALTTVARSQHSRLQIQRDRTRAMFSLYLASATDEED